MDAETASSGTTGLTYSGILASSQQLGSFSGNSTGTMAESVPRPNAFNVSAYIRSLPVQQLSIPVIQAGFGFEFLSSPDGAEFLVLNGYLEGRDGSADAPFLPDETTDDGTSRFRNVPGIGISDPIPAWGFRYETTDGSLFTDITAFPTGFDDPFTVSVGSTVLGQYSPGETLTFPGGGVSSFSLTGISPLVDAEDPLAFPLGLAFVRSIVSFDMIPLSQSSVPEPSSLALFTLGGIGLHVFGSNRRRLPGEPCPHVVESRE
jgi:hypothetical protein